MKLRTKQITIWQITSDNFFLIAQLFLFNFFFYKDNYKKKKDKNVALRFLKWKGKKKQPPQKKTKKTTTEFSFQVENHHKKGILDRPPDHTY